MFTYVSTYIYMCTYVHLYICTCVLSLSLSLYLCAYLSVCLFIFLPVYLSVCLSASLSVRVSVPRSSHLSTCVSSYPSICLCVQISICLYVSVCRCKYTYPCIISTFMHPCMPALPQNNSSNMETVSRTRMVSHNLGPELLAPKQSNPESGLKLRELSGRFFTHVRAVSYTKRYMQGDLQYGLR